MPKVTPPRPQAMPGGNGTRLSGPSGPWVLFSPRTSSWEQRGLGELESPPQRFRQGPARCLSFPGPRSAVVTSQVAARPRLPDRRFPGTVMLLVSREFRGGWGAFLGVPGRGGPSRSMLCFGPGLRQRANPAGPGRHTDGLRDSGGQDQAWALVPPCGHTLKRQAGDQSWRGRFT